VATRGAVWQANVEGGVLATKISRFGFEQTPTNTRPKPTGQQNGIRMDIRDPKTPLGVATWATLWHLTLVGVVPPTWATEWLLNIVGGVMASQSDRFGGQNHMAPKRTLMDSKK
jgi:hypothetical protein